MDFDVDTVLGLKFVRSISVAVRTVCVPIADYISMIALGMRCYK
jgi:hypothetical protein